MKPSGNPFKDQKTFMEACGQTTSGLNVQQAKLYSKLVNEEINEMVDEAVAGNTLGTFDGLLDSIVVLIGYAYSMGWDIEGGWNEVMGTNFAKIDPITGKVLRREDGKILKGPNWVPPNLAPFLGESSDDLASAAGV